MGKYLNIHEAATLTGRPTEEIRRIALGVISKGSDAEQALVKPSAGGQWLLHTDLLEELMKIRASKQGKPNHSSNDRNMLMDILARQLETKDQQINRLQEQMTQMIERNREMNVMLHKLQQHVALTAENEPFNGHEPTDKDTGEPEQFHDSPLSDAPASFSEWAKRFR